MMCMWNSMACTARQEDEVSGLTFQVYLCMHR